MDGTFSSGKSSIARAVSKKLNILYLNSGELFRACGYYCLENNIDPNDKDKVVEAMKNVSLTIKYIDGKQHTFINDNDVSDTSKFLKWWKHLLLMALTLSRPSREKSELLARWATSKE